MGAPVGGARERNRLARHHGYLRAALGLVYSEGLHALTMQRLAEVVGASVGSVYTYFPSKGALVAEVQREAIERLAVSASLLAADVDRAVEDRHDAVVWLAPVVGFGRFWLAASGTHPQEMRLLLQLLSDSGDTVPETEGHRVVPAAMGFLALAETRIRAAVDVGVLGAGEAWPRTVALGAALTGCLHLGVVEHWDPQLLDPLRAGRTVLDALLCGWGADPADLDAAHTVIDALAARAPLARPVPRGDL